MSDTQLILALPPTSTTWFNNFITAILYSQYSRKILKDNNDTFVVKLKDIFKFNTSKSINDALNEFFFIKPENNKKDLTTEFKVNYFDSDDNIQKLINIDFYKKLLENDSQLTAFILPKFLEFIGASCISIERYNKKNYIGLYDLVEYIKEIKEVPAKRRIFFNIMKLEPEPVPEQINVFKFKLKKIKRAEIKEKYDKEPQYILINKWTNDNIPKDVLDAMINDDESKDADGINNDYRLSSTYINNSKLEIDDKIEEQITYKNYYYKLDSCIISNNNNKSLLTFLTHNNKKYVYLNNKDCTNLHEIKSFREAFSIYSKFPCEIFRSKKKFGEKDQLSSYNTKENNYTLIYVKFKTIEEEKKEQEEQQNKEKDEKKKNVLQKLITTYKIHDRSKKINEIKELKNKYNELEKEKEAKIKELEKEKVKIKQLEKEKDKLDREKQADIDKDIENIQDIIKELPDAKKEDFKDFKDLIDLLNEYIQILKNNEFDNIQKYKDIKSSINIIKHIQDEITKNDEKNKEYKLKPDNKKTKYEKIFISNYAKIKMYLTKFINFIINLLSRQNIISLIKDEIKDLPNNENIKQITDLLTPTDAKFKQILSAIDKLPADAKLKKIEDLLTPTDAKLNQILEAIAKMPKEDYTKIIQDAIDKMPKQDNKKLIDDLNAKMDAMQQTLLSKIEEQRAIVSRSKSKDNITLQTEIDELKRQLQLMGDIQKQLSEVSKQDYTKIIQEAIDKMPKQDNKKLIDDLNAKMDVMQQTSYKNN